MPPPGAPVCFLDKAAVLTTACATLIIALISTMVFWALSSLPRESLLENVYAVSSFCNRNRIQIRKVKLVYDMDYAKSNGAVKLHMYKVGVQYRYFISNNNNN